MLILILLISLVMLLTSCGSSSSSTVTPETEGYPSVAISQGMTSPVRWCPDDRCVMAGTRDNISIWDTNGELIKTLDVAGQNAQVTSISFHPRQPQILVGVRVLPGANPPPPPNVVESFIEVWDWDRGQRLNEISSLPEEDIAISVWNADASYVLVKFDSFFC